MSSPATDCEELRITIERLRALLEELTVRGLRACGPDQLRQLESFAQQLEQSGAGHVGAALADLHARIGTGDRAAARALLMAQTSVRLLERLLTLRMVRSQYDVALSAVEQPGTAAPGDNGAASDDEDEEAEA